MFTYTLRRLLLAVPTVLLSNHPGLGLPRGTSIDIAPLLEGAEAAGGLAGIDAILTGYFGNAAQVRAAASLIARLKPAHVLVDPVIGDIGRLYVKDEIAGAIRDHLMPLATITTPNAFELAWLTGQAVSDVETARAAARTLSCPEVIVTSVPHGPDHLATLLLAGETHTVHTTARRDRVPNGTGDFFSGAYLARRVTEASVPAFTAAMARLAGAIAASVGPVLYVV